MKTAIFALAVSTLVAPLTAGQFTERDSMEIRPEPIVSCEWLQRNANLAGLKVVDVRTAAEYGAGHIQNSVNIPFEMPVSTWITVRDDLMLELPEPAELFTALGNFGLSVGSTVVIVTSLPGDGQPPYPLAGGTRVADTLRFAGVKSVSILDGGYPRWVADGRPTTTATPTVTPVIFAGVPDRTRFVDIAGVRGAIGKSLILDARDASVYSGEVVEDWAKKPGHIPSAISLPAPLMWNADGTYKSKKALAELVLERTKALDKKKEIIVYCGVGGYASSWLYVLTEVLGYKNVKMYDGSAQEWARYHDMVPGTTP